MYKIGGGGAPGWRELTFHKTPLALAVLTTSPYKTVKELIDHAKKNPGAVTVGGSGSFSGYHMATLRFEKLIGAKLTQIAIDDADE